MKANGKFRADEKAVSPVIGVILMVAITVILAAIIAAFVFGMAPPEMAPQASIRGTVTQVGTENVIKLAHQGGDTLTIDSANVKVLVNDEVIDVYPGTGTQFSVGESAYIGMNASGGVQFNETLANVDVGDDLPASGQSAHVIIVDVASQQYIADITVRG